MQCEDTGQIQKVQRTDCGFISNIQTLFFGASFQTKRTDNLPLLGNNAKRLKQSLLIHYAQLWQM